MSNEENRRELTVRNGDVSFAGTLWLPVVGEPAAVVLMHPGSGASDRDNDVLFPPIRDHLLRSGLAVCSFDKRGVGGSTGRWQEAAIVEQANDALACLEALLSDEELGTHFGLFGHSQGGWVVIEAAGRHAPVSFVVSSSGPGVTPAEQERYSAQKYLERSGAAGEEIAVAMHDFDLVVAMMRERVDFDDAKRRIEEEGLGAIYDDLDLPFVPEDEAVWNLACALIDYDPRPALEQVRAPVLALFGGDDAIVPVDESVAVYREAVRPDLLTLAVFPDADHRVQTGDPPRMADGYLETLSSFIVAAVT
jgi:pimeloyl-ACP methyl ester carboxylesterase